MSIDQDADSEQHLARWLEKHWIRIAATVIALAIVGVAVCFTIRGWGWLGSAQADSDSNSAVLRNISLVAAGVVSVGLVFWRNTIASRQATATEEQTKATIVQARAMREQAKSIREQVEASRAQLKVTEKLTQEEMNVARTQVESNELQIQVQQAEVLAAEQRASGSQFQRGEELLWSEQIAARISGIEMLRRLGLEAPDPYPSRVVHLLCTFVRHSSQTAAATQVTPGDRVQAVLAAAITYQRLRERVPNADGSLDLTETDLAGAMLEGANLTDARLEESDLTKARLAGTILTNARLGSSTAYRADFRGANLAGAHLNCAGLAGANFTGAELPGADLTEARFVPPREEYHDLLGLLNSATHEQPSEIVAIGLTQQQLDAAVAEPGRGPLLNGLRDPGSGKLLEWRGGSRPHTAQSGEGNGQNEDRNSST